jgi:hypothetical protein
MPRPDRPMALRKQPGPARSGAGVGFCRRRPGQDRDGFGKARANRPATAGPSVLPSVASSYAEEAGAAVQVLGHYRTAQASFLAAWPRRLGRSGQLAQEQAQATRVRILSITEAFAGHALLRHAEPLSKASGRAVAAIRDWQAETDASPFDEAIKDVPTGRTRMWPRQSEPRLPPARPALRCSFADRRAAPPRRGRDRRWRGRRRRLVLLIGPSCAGAAA